MNDKELIRRALMGDEKAQEECTNRAIILPCPFCGGEAELVEEAGLHSIRCKFGFCIGNDIQPEYGEAMCALADWNTRPAPSIGRCGECAAYGIFRDNQCANTGCYRTERDFCSDFHPKEENNGNQDKRIKPRR